MPSSLQTQVGRLRWSWLSVVVTKNPTWDENNAPRFEGLFLILISNRIDGRIMMKKLWKDYGCFVWFIVAVILFTLLFQANFVLAIIAFFGILLLSNL